MNYIKNNKIFLFLFLSFSIIILSLAYRLTNGNQKGYNRRDIENTQHSSNSITYFNGAFSDIRLGIEFSWNVQVASGNAVEKYEILQDETVLKSGKNAASTILTMKEYKFLTGNNKFDLVVIFRNGETLTKTVYVYINEAYDFHVSQTVEANVLKYHVTYYYDERRPVTPPQMQITNTTQPFQVQYISASETKKEGHYISMSAEYELSYQGVDVGKYSVDIKWDIPKYNLSYNSNSMIDVSGD